MKRFLLSLVFFSFVLGQTEPLVDIQHVTPRVFLLKNGIVHTQPGQTIDNGCVLIRNGLIEYVGNETPRADDATVVDLAGAHLYAGFIDSWLEVDTKDVKPTFRSHWSSKVHPEWVTADFYQAEEKFVEKLRSQGFTSIHAVPGSGIFRGQSSLIALDRDARVIKSSISQILDFETGSWESTEYPGALLGTIAVMRQTLYDGDWYGQAQDIYAKYPDLNEPVKEDLALDAIASARRNNSPFMFQTDQDLDATRAMAVAREFNLDLWLLGSGFEYRRLPQISQAHPFVVVPVDYPGKPDVANPNRSLQYTTDQLKHWDMAPDNAARLAEAGILIAVTTNGLKDVGRFHANLVRSVRRGLSETTALEALTTAPAKRFGLDQTYGKIQAGFTANFTVVDGSYFTEDAEVRSVWIGGVEYPVQPKLKPDFTGNWSIDIGNLAGKLSFTGKTNKLKGSLQIDSLKLKLREVAVDGDRISWLIEADTLIFSDVTRFAGQIAGAGLSGYAYFSDNNIVSWSAGNRTPAKADKPNENNGESKSDLTVFSPEGAYGFEQTPEQPYAVLVNNATIWTSGPLGILKDWDMLVVDGKIKKIARDITIPRGGAVLIEGSGKYITPGLIDAHSHSAASSINEGTQSVTAEVRIQDVLDPDDISIYREMAGGLTMANILHGSANVIGGQNAVIKLRWGTDADGLLFQNSPPGIKFALGENVKQSNWGDKAVTRYPQTRMGVETILRDAFTRAQDYRRNWDAYNKNSKWQKTLIPPRKDLELDALVEVLEGKRLVHCHSYRQDEILMLTRVAEDFGFTVATFQHVLEGYKVAERMAQHGAGGSCFTDWWAYKFEVYDAIPYNGTLMQGAGVLVSFNSDSDELARRMNLEGAKGIKYGGMTEIEALNTVTINPARQLKIDKWVGSLEEGKDADFVVWSGNPLSTQTICEQTWIDGRQYFSLEKDAQLVQRDQALRQSLIQKILKSKNDDSPSMAPDQSPEDPGDACLAGDDNSWKGGSR